ncbi:capsular biosynthesis protein [Staphylococcus hominis]|uniref:Capsular biosynthesis protein n=4 Tax=Staphylococcus hominis TaxID=1290 RepID=A0A974KVB5_STAHO|nr:capsular biosynthesis protein [Staphylococcus hominis]
MNKFINIFIFTITLVSFLIIISKNETYLAFLPLSYMIGNIFLIISKNANLNYTKYVMGVLGFIRFVLIPTLIAITGDKIIDSLPLGHSYFNKAIAYMSIEYVILTAIFLLLSNLFNKRKKLIQIYYLVGSKNVYYIFIVIVFLIFLVVPSTRESLSFLIIKTDATGRGSEETNSFAVLIRMYVQLALALIFVILSYRAYKIYQINPKFRYIILPLILGLINISLIVGERRSIQLYTLVSVLMITSVLFKKHRKKINSIILGVGIVVLGLMTLYKELYIFNYSSYSAAIRASSEKPLKIVDDLQSYFYGPSNVAASIDYLNFYPGSLNQLGYDIGRSLFGLNFFIRSDRLITSQLFNELIYGNQQLTGHLISSAGYGIIYFSPFLFFIPVLFNLILSTIFEIIIRNTNGLEILFIATYMYVRVVTNMFGNPIPIVTLISSVIVLYSIIIFISILLKRPKNL